MKLELNKMYWNSKFFIETLENEGSIKISSPEPRSSGGDSYYNVTIIIDKETYNIGDIGAVSWRQEGGVGGFFLSQMIEQNIDCILKEIKYLHYEIKYRKIPSVKSKILKALKELPSTKSGLRFNSFKTISDDKIVVDYYGHEVNGSYVYDYQVTPKYIDYLQVESNRKVTWNGRRRNRSN